MNIQNSGFIKHKINHGSASMFNKADANLRLWALQYLFGFRDESGPAAARGLAVEGGMELILRNKPGALDAAYAAFDASMQGEISDKIEAERAMIPGMIEQIEQWKPPAPLLASQVKIEHWFDEVPIPIVGFIDFVFEDASFIDLKTTKACPSAGRPEHVRQIALYSEARKGAAGGLLYVTPKRLAHYPMADEQRTQGIAELRAIASFLDRFLLAFDSPEDALRATAPNTADFRWNDAARSKLSEILGAA